MTDDEIQFVDGIDEPAEPAPAPGPRRTRRGTRGPAGTPARSARGGLIAAGILLAAVLMLGGGGVWWTFYRAEAAVPAGRTVTIVVPKGASSGDVATLLASKGVVANSMMFKLRAQSIGLIGELKAGTYEFKTGSAYEPVIRSLATGPVIDYVTLVIPEGWSIQRIAARVESKLKIPAADFIALATTGKSKFDFTFLADDPTPTLQGYLFPKTYQVKASATATDVISMMLAQYGKETASIDYSYAKSKKLTPHDVLTIASIIEREVFVDKDRPTVASVIYNRLHIRMRLQLDSTVQYALNGKAKLNLKDLWTVSPYNTYRNYGLPPGPIDNPGLASIKAAAAPSKTPYIYYILTHKDGSQSFTTNYAAFLVLKAQAAKGLK